MLGISRGDWWGRRSTPSLPSPPARGGGFPPGGHHSASPGAGGEGREGVLPVGYEPFQPMDRIVAALELRIIDDALV